MDGEIEDTHSSKVEGDKLFSLTPLICELISDVITMENLGEKLNKSMNEVNINLCMGLCVHNSFTYFC